MQTWYYWEYSKKLFIFCPEENIKEATKSDIESHYYKCFPEIENLEDYYLCFYWRGFHLFKCFVEKRKVKKIEGFSKSFVRLFKNSIEYCKLLFVPEWQKVFIEKRNEKENDVTILFYAAQKNSIFYKYQEGDELKQYNEILSKIQMKKILH